MAVRKRLLFLSSVLVSLLSSRFKLSLAFKSDSFVFNTFAVFTVLLSVNFLWGAVIYPHFFSPLRHLPQPKDGNFLLGHFVRIFKQPTGEPQKEWLETVPNDGLIYYRWLFNEPRVMLTSPKALAEVLVQRSYEFVKPRRVRNGIRRILGNGVLLAEGDEHKRQRRQLMPAFAFRHVKDLYPIFWAKSREMTKAMLDTIRSSTEASNGVEIGEWASRAALDIIGVAGVGQDFRAISDPSNELFRTYRTIFSSNKTARILAFVAAFLPETLLRLLPLKRNDDIREAVNTIKKTAMDLVRSKRSKLEKGERTDLDILSVAMESGGFSDEDIVNQLMTFLAAGHETTASSLSWAVYLLCKHPEVQSRLRDELRSQLPRATLTGDPTEEGNITSQDIDKLAYLNAVINEVLRLFPPVPLTFRECEYDTTIQGQLIPADTRIVVAPWVVNKSLALWGNDAMEFNPDRWRGTGRANTGGAESNYASLTFLHGPRSCIGKDFAKAEFACLVAALVGAFEMELEDKDWELKIGGAITARPKGGLRVVLTPVGEGEKA